MYTNEIEVKLADYESLTAVRDYGIGFIVKHQLYLVFTNSLPIEWLRIEKASRGQGWSLRLRMTKEVRESLMTTAICLGSEDLLIDEKYNKGETFERCVAEYYGLPWAKDTKCFTDGGDLNINGVEVQIKLNTATITTEKTLNRQKGLRG